MKHQMMRQKIGMSRYWEKSRNLQYLKNILYVTKVSTTQIVIALLMGSVIADAVM